LFFTDHALFMIFASTNWRSSTGFGPSVTTSTV
jgi:hypothetical protein